MPQRGRQREIAVLARHRLLGLGEKQVDADHARAGGAEEIDRLGEALPRQRPATEACDGVIIDEDEDGLRSRRERPAQAQPGVQREELKPADPGQVRRHQMEG